MDGFLTAVHKRFGSLIAFGIFSTGLFAPVLIAHQPVDCSERKRRAGKSGKAITLLTEDDGPILPALAAYLQSTGQPVPPELARAAALPCVYA